MSEMAEKVAFLNPKTCGIYKNGAPRYRTDPSTGVRTGEIDNELMEAVDRYLAGKRSEDVSHVSLRGVFEKRILVPAYYDRRFDAGVKRLLGRLGAGRVTIGKLLDSGIIGVRGGHGSPGNDQRNGYIPYIKVSDVRGLRVNVNPTNLVPRSVAERYWGRSRQRTEGVGRADPQPCEQQHRRVRDPVAGRRADRSHEGSVRAESP